MTALAEDRKTSGPGPAVDVINRLVRHVVSGGASSIDVISPVHGQLIASVPESTTQDTEHAFHFARRAQEQWRATPIAQRAKIMLRFHDLVLRNRDEGLDIAQWETGKARKDANEELLDTCINARHYARSAKKLLKPKRHLGVFPGMIGVKEYQKPKGVVGIISPWNYPLTLTASDAIAALMAGNTVVLKPDSQTPLSGLWMADMFERAGIPQGVFNVVVGSGSKLGSVMTSNSNYMMFTGCTRVGRIIAAACGERLIGCSLELGGKNAMVILDDADVEKAVDLTVRASFANSGQLCISMERVYVPRNLWTDYVAALAARVRGLSLSAQVGWGADMGSLINESQLETITRHVKDAVANGARVIAGGKARPDLGPFVFEPTVLTDVTEAAVACREETFGPLVSLYPYEGEAEAIRMANDTVYGLNGSVVTSDLKRGQRVAIQLNAGTINVNEGYGAAWGSVRSPMGGFGDSGLGRRHGDEGLLKCTESQSVATMRAMSMAPPMGMDEEQWGDTLTKAIKGFKVVGLR